MIVSYRNLQSLQDQQINALAAYLAQCGKTIAIDFPEAIYKQLQAGSGCRSEFLLPAATIAELLPQLDKLLRLKPTPLPEPELVLPQTAASGFFNHAALLAAFCFGYLIWLCLTAIFGKRKIFSLSLPILAAGVALLVWSRQAPETRLYTWLDASSGQTIAHYRAALQITAIGKWQGTLSLPLEAALAAGADQAVAEQNYPPLQDTATSELKLPLLSTAAWRWQAALKFKPPLELKQQAQQLLVHNISEHATEPGLALWQGKLYTLPALAGGQSWSPGAEFAADDSPLAKLLVRQTAAATSAVLLPFTPDILPFKTEQAGWLLLHDAEFIS